MPSGGASLHTHALRAAAEPLWDNWRHWGRVVAGMVSGRRRNNIALVGLMGAGKTTVGRCLAARLQHHFLDCDAEIERRAGRSVLELFERRGEPFFRRLEAEVLAALAVRRGAVLATGGGIVLAAANRAVLKRCGAVVYLRVSLDHALCRVGGSASRPLLSDGDPGATLGRLLAEREPLYRAVADHEVDGGGMAATVAQRIIEQLGEAP